MTAQSRHRLTALVRFRVHGLFVAAVGECRKRLGRRRRSQTAATTARRPSRTSLRAGPVAPVCDRRRAVSDNDAPNPARSPGRSTKVAAFPGRLPHFTFRAKLMRTTSNLLMVGILLGFQEQRELVTSLSAAPHRSTHFQSSSQSSETARKRCDPLQIPLSVGDRVASLRTVQPNVRHRPIRLE